MEKTLSPGLIDWSPSARVFPFFTSVGLFSFKDLVYLAILTGSTPITSLHLVTPFVYIAIPEIRPPPPIGTIIFKWSILFKISTAIVPWPFKISSSS